MHSASWTADNISNLCSQFKSIVVKKNSCQNIFCFGESKRKLEEKNEDRNYWNHTEEKIIRNRYFLKSYRAKAGRPARTYIQQLCEDTGSCPEDLPEAMNDREKWRERVRDIRATSTTWWWWWMNILFPLAFHCKMDYSGLWIISLILTPMLNKPD